MDIKYDECAWCASRDSHKLVAYFKKASSYNKYHFCSRKCFSKFESKSGFLICNDFGRTADEQNEYDIERRDIDRKNSDELRQKNINKKKSILKIYGSDDNFKKVDRKNSKFIRRIELLFKFSGPIIVYLIIPLFIALFKFTFGYKLVVCLILDLLFIYLIAQPLYKLLISRIESSKNEVQFASKTFEREFDDSLILYFNGYFIMNFIIYLITLFIVLLILTFYIGRLNPHNKIEKHFSISKKIETVQNLDYNKESITVSKGFADSNDIADFYIGIWQGEFGNKTLTLVIESVNPSGEVEGYNEVNGVIRNLSGKYKNHVFTLNELGDDKWDGVFTFHFEQNSNTLKGEWLANNNRLQKKFEISKIE